MKQSADEVEAKNQHATDLEIQVEFLQQQLQTTEEQYKEKVRLSSELNYSLIHQSKDSDALRVKCCWLSNNLVYKK